jgi:hypothetical protein
MTNLKRFLCNRPARPQRDRCQRRLGFEALEERKMMAAVSGDFDGNSYKDLALGSLRGDKRKEDSGVVSVRPEIVSR